MPSFLSPLRALPRLSLCLLAIGSTQAVAQEVPDLPGWDLVWNDEFTGRSLDTEKWTALDRRDSHNNEKQYYHPDQVAVVGGELRLTAIDEPRAGKAYQSGLVVSNDLFGPGRFEARIDLPTSQGMWPAFWLNANHVSWPLGGEIDILENRGSQPTLVSSAYHWQKDPGPCCDQHRYVFEEYTGPAGEPPVNFHEGFHTYAAEWDETTVKFYVDDELHFTITENRDMPIVETTKNIILNLAVGGDFGGDPNGTTVWPQTMRVDYVRYWQPAAPGIEGDFNGDGEVDAADYTLWRDTYGQTGSGLPADANGDQTVNHLDWQVWRDAYGSSAPAAFVPEPTAGALAVSLSAVAVSATRRSDSDRSFARRDASPHAVVSTEGRGGVGR